MFHFIFMLLRGAFFLLRSFFFAYSLFHGVLFVFLLQMVTEESSAMTRGGEKMSSNGVRKPLTASSYMVAL